MDAIFDYMGQYDYENLFFCQDKTLDFRAVIAVHDTTLGPATGGCRMWNQYAGEMEAGEVLSPDDVDLVAGGPEGSWIGDSLRRGRFADYGPEKAMAAAPQSRLATAAVIGLGRQHPARVAAARLGHGIFQRGAAIRLRGC